MYLTFKGQVTHFDVPYPYESITYLQVFRCQQSNNISFKCSQIEFLYTHNAKMYTHDIRKFYLQVVTKYGKIRPQKHTLAAYGDN